MTIAFITFFENSNLMALTLLLRSKPQIWDEIFPHCILTALTLTLDSRKPENCILANQGDVICCQAIDMHYCKLHKSWKS